MKIQRRYHEQIAKRAKTVAIIIALVFSCLIARLFWLQVICGFGYEQRALHQHWKKEKLPARRGEIRDRNGILLAISRTGFSCYADPRKVKNVSVAAKRLAPVLQVPESKLATRLSQNERKFVWLKRLLSAQEAKRVRDLGLDGIDFRKEPRRYYPHGRLAAHVLGFVGVDNIGLEGIEASFSRELSGQDGYTWMLRDGRRRQSGIYAPGVSCSAVHGGTVYLTIDIEYQRILEEQLDWIVGEYDPLGAAGVLIEVKSGEILAMASRPTYDPNDFRKYEPKNWRNLAIADGYELGSVMKPFIVAAALTEKLLTKDTVIFCHNGKYRTDFGRVLKDSHPHGDLTVAEIIIKSSNIGAAIIGQALGKKRVRRYLSYLKFGAKTGIALPGESTGELKPLSKWSEYTLTSVPMGHEIGITVLQMATAYNVIAGNGIYWPPSIVKKIVYPNGSVSYHYPVKAVRIYPKHVIATMQVMLRRVVEEGTAKRANVKMVAIAGKTGTAQKFDKEAKKYSSSKHISVFAGFAPAENPGYVCVIMVDEAKGAYSGGKVSAPSVAKVLRQVCLSADFARFAKER